MQFLLDGVAAGEPCAYVTFSETADELRQSAKSHGWSLDSISIVELTKGSAEQELEEEYTVLHSADAELSKTLTALLEEIKRLKPQRMVLDSLSELRMVARDPLRYRRHVLALKQTLTSAGCTAIFLEDRTGGAESDLLLQSIAHSVLQLTSELSINGGVHRRIQVMKMRGVEYIDGQHDCRIVRGGLRGLSTSDSV
jgi:circadian clock protein KaiC